MEAKDLNERQLEWVRRRLEWWYGNGIISNAVMLEALPQDEQNAAYAYYAQLRNLADAE